MEALKVMTRLEEELNNWWEEERKPIADLEYSVPIIDDENYEEDEIEEEEQDGDEGGAG